MKPNKTNPLFARFFRGNTLVAAVVLSLGATSLPNASAQSISVNFGADRSGSTITEAAKTAGAIPVAGNRWNNTAVNGGGTLGSLIDSTGATTGGSVTWTAQNTWQSGSGGATATSENGDLTKGYLDDSGSGWTVNLKSPYLLNDVYVIHATDQGSPATMSAVSVNGRFYVGNGAGGTVAVSGSAFSWSAGNFSTADALVESTNFLKVLNQGGVVLAGLNSSPGRSAIAGVQVVNTYAGTLSYWDLDGTIPGAGGATPTGTWDTTTANWSTSATGDLATGAWTASNAAVFSAGSNATGAYTVQVAGPVTADAVWAKDGTVTLSDGGSGVINLAGNAILRGDAQLVVSAPISAAALNTHGNVTLGSATNSITGLATISGTTTLAIGQTFGSLAGAGTVALGTNTLTVGSDNTDSQFFGLLTGSGAVSKTGSGRLSIGNNITGYTGTASSNSGVLRIGTGGTSGSLSGTLAVNGTVEVFRSDSNTQPTVFTGAGTLKLLGTGVSGQSYYTLSGTTSGFTGAVSVEAARLRVDTANLDNCSSITAVSGGQAWLFAGNHAENYIINGNGWVEPTGELGAIRFESNANLTGSLNVASDSRVVAWGTNGTVSGTLTGSAALNLNLVGNPGTLNFTGNTVGYTGTMTFNAGTLNIGASGLGGSLVVNGRTGTAGAGATVNITGNPVSVLGGIAGNLTVEGGTATADGAAAVATVVGGVVTVQGTVGGNVSLNAGSSTSLNGGVATGVGGTATLNGGVTGNVTVADGAVLGGEGAIAGTLNLGSASGSTLRVNAATAGALSAGTVNLAGTNTVSLSNLPTAAGPFVVLGYTTLAGGDENNFVVPSGLFRGDPQVQHDIANSQFTLELDSQVRTWNNAGLTGTWNTTDINWVEGDVYYSGDDVVFTDTAVGTVNLATGLQPLSITFQNTAGNDYTLTGGGIAGSTGISMTGGGNLTLGGANTFTGAITVNSGVLALGTATALGQTSGVTVVAGARVNLAGWGVGNNINTTWTIAGDGGDGAGGLGAVFNTGGEIYEDSSILNLTLSGNAEIGGNNGRFDVGRNGVTGAGGVINGAGFTLTKTGTNAMVFRGPASDITYVLNAGQLTFEDYDSASGTNAITVNAGRLGTYGARTISNDVSFAAADAFLVSQSNNGMWTGTIDLAGNTTFQADGNLIIDGTLSGTGNITKTGGGVLVMQSAATGYSGKLTVNAGTLRVENNAALGTATGADVIKIGNATLQGGTITAQTSTTIGSATVGITHTGTGTVVYDAGTGNTLTINAPVVGGTTNVVVANGVTDFTAGLIANDTAQGDVRIRSGGTLRFSGGTVATRVLAVGHNGYNPTVAGLDITAGATVTTEKLMITDGGGYAATVNQSGGSLTITGTNSANSNQASFLMGHWGGSATYNLSGGTLSATGAVLSLGWDSAAGVNFNQSGGTANLLGINIGNTRNNPATYDLTGGRLNIGASGITTNTNKIIKFGTATVGAFADWSSAQNIILTGGSTTIDTLDSVDGTTGRVITLSGNLSGTGGLAKTGLGTLLLTGTGSFTGTATVNGGTLHVVNNAAAAGTLGTAAGGSLRPGTLAAPGVATTTNLSLGGGSADFRIGTSTDKLTATGAFNVEAPTAIQAIPINAISGTFPQYFDVIDYTGTIGGASGLAGLSFASSNPHLSGELFNDETNTVIQVKINSADTVVWKGNVDGNWDVNATSNWVLGSDLGVSSTYYDFDVVKFDDTGIATPAVTLVGSITPATLSVENTTGTYVFSGSGIGGGTGLTKTGAGGLMLLNNNTYTGVVSITGGRVDVGNGGADGTLGGTGGITLDAGTTLAFNTTTNHSLLASRPVNGGGAMEKSGSGTLEFQGTHGFASGMTINGGTVLLNSAGGELGVISGVVTVNAGGTLSATGGNAFGYGGQRIHTLNLNGGTATTSVNGDQGWAITVNLGDGGTLATSGQGYYSLGGGSSVNYTGTTTSATISGTIRLRENNTNGRLPINVADGAAAVDVNVSGAITQAAAGHGISKSGAGTLQLSGDNTFSGPIEITAGTVRVSRPQHSVVANALTGTGGVLEHASPQQLVLSGDGSNFAGTIDANGKEVRLAHDTAGAGTGGTLALEGGTLALGLNTEGFLYYGTFAGAAMDTTPLAAGALATSASGLHGGIGENTTIAYDGEIYLTAGDWSFGENVDDAVYVKVDASVLINDNAWNTPTSGTFNAPSDGWYPITLRVQNGGGGNGPVDAWATAGIGIGIKQGAASTNVGDYVKFEIGALGTNCRVFKAAGTNTMAGTLALGGGVANTIDTAGGSLALNGPVTGGASESLVKNGAGTLSLNAVNTYTGDTVVNAGTVAVNGASIKDTNKLVLDGGMLDLTGTERVTTLFYGATQQADGTYGATGSGATNIDDARFSGTGVLVVGVPTGYAAWAGTNAPTGGAGDDYDGDGVSNGVEYVLGGSGTASDLAKLPTVSASGGDLVFTFVRDQDSKTSDTTVQIEVGTTLATWPGVYNVGDDTAGSSAGVTVTDNLDGTDTITLTIAKGVDAAKFGRLKVTIN